MNCLLCLNSLLGGADCVNMDSTEVQQLEVKNIIEKNFVWLKLAIHRNERKDVCRPCWESLLSFHDFYKRIAEAHKTLMCEDVKLSDPRSNEDEVSPLLFQGLQADEIQIKIEPEIIVTQPKRGRGRPRRQPLEPTRQTRASSKHEDEDDFGIEELYVSDIKPNIVENSEDVNAIDVLNFIESFDANVPAQTTDTNSFKSKDKDETNLVAKREKRDKRKCRSKQNARKVPADDDDDKDDLDETKLAKSCQDLSEKSQTWEESDKFIAEHFKLTCCICNVTLESFTSLKTHFRVEHQMNGYVICCGRKLLKRCRLVDHLRTHQDPAYFKCKLCDKILASRNCLDLHMKRHDETRERKFQCEIYSKKFLSRIVYGRHKLLHLPDEEKTVQCLQCTKTFATNYLMKQHLKLVHLNTYGKICDICGKSVIGREALRRHLEEHSGVQQPPAKCEICGITLTSKYGLTQHIKMMHMQENRTPQVCPICSKVSPGQKAHMRHMEYMHTLDRKYACPMCDKAFKRPKGLREHMTTHTGEVLYTCPHCPKTFNSNANMYSHRKKFHTKEWEERRMYRFKKNAPKIGVPNKVDENYSNTNVPEST